MVCIGRISKGSKMDQVYIPKNRSGLQVGSYVMLKEIKDEKKVNLFYYGIKNLGPIKVDIIERIYRIIEEYDVDNIIITGSFLDKGFRFDDVDIVVLNEIEVKGIDKRIKNEIGVETHVTFFNSKEIIKGLETDPMFSIMLSKCVSSKRFLFKTKRKFNYKILDLNLLESKSVLDGWEVLDGRLKYKLTRNMAAISLFVNGKKVTRESVEKYIKEQFKIEIDEIKNNMIERQQFLKIFRKIYTSTFKEVMDLIPNAKQEKTR